METRANQHCYLSAKYGRSVTFRLLETVDFTSEKSAEDLQSQDKLHKMAQGLSRVATYNHLSLLSTNFYRLHT